MTALELMEALGEAEEELLWPALNTKTHRSYRRVLRTFLIAAAVLVLLALAALAASESGLLERLFPGKYDLIADYVTHVEASAENEVLRFTIHEAVTDGYCGVMVYSVERLDGGELDGWILDAQIVPYAEDGTVLRYGGSYPDNLITGEETPQQRWYLWKTFARVGLHRISVRVFGLYRLDTGEKVTGEALDLEAELTLCPVKTALRSGDPAGKDLYPVAVVSPLSFYAGVLRNLSGMTPENAPKNQSRIISGPADCRVELLYRDGSSLDLSDAVLRRDSQETSFGSASLYCVFEELVDIRKLKALRIEGVEYALVDGSPPKTRKALADAPSQLDSARYWLFGDHAPAHPALEASGERVKLSVDGIWTDGITTELMLQIDAPREEAYWQFVDRGGSITMAAEDRSGAPLAVGALSGGMLNGLYTLVVECSGKASQLTVGDGDALLTIPLDMKTLAKLPQIEPQEATPRQTAGTNEWETFRASVYEGLFAGVKPDDTGYSADNGIYRLTAVHLYLTEDPGLVRLRAWLEAERLDGEPYEIAEEARSAFEICGLKDGAEIVLNGGLGSQGGVHNGTRYFIMNEDYRYGDFEILGVQGAGVMPAEGLDLETLDLDGLRITWTPPAGGRITLDLPMTTERG